MKTMNDDSGFVRGGAAFAIGQIGGEEAEEALEAALNDKSSYVRKVAQNYLSRG
ncbi:MAG TPA: hypothetical protein PKK85_00275 [Methanobacteriaceae archaeon]|nr:hypothetical protein [Methanobacteriaceae archaeon]